MATIDLCRPSAHAQDDPTLKPVLADVQANILVSHGREHVSLLLLRFTGDRQTARTVVTTLGRFVVTAAQARASASGKPTAYDDKHVNLFLSRSGYAALGIGDTDPRLPADPAFRQGMPARAHLLGDPPASGWADGYRGGDIDAIVLIADVDLDVVQRQTQSVRDYLARKGITVWQEVGHVLRDPNDTDVGVYGTIEHFGFKDGRSQPLFFADEIAEERAGGGIEHYDPSAPLDLVLTPDPGSPQGGYGSYLVFRKLEQDVQGFARHLRALAAARGTTPDDVGAAIVGRYPNGMPVTMAGQPAATEPPNNFNFNADPAGAVCPMHSHIRSINPRDPEQARQRIARRAVPYDEVGRGPPPWDDVPLDALPTHGVGLLFMCFQADIATQFEALQAKVHGCAREPAPDTPRRLEDFVTLLGGGYFFAPSPSFLQSLG